MSLVFNNLRNCSKEKSMRVQTVFVLALLATLIGAGCQQPAPPAAAPEPTEPPRDGVFLHISSGPENPHRVLMALKMAELMAADRDVVVYFDIKGIEVVLADAEDISYTEFPSSLTQLANLLEIGVPVYACPGCLKAAGKTPDDLADGIQVANKDAFFDFTDGRILTLDY
jgi:predicted peroxiredoxin